MIALVYLLLAYYVGRMVCRRLIGQPDDLFRAFGCPTGYLASLSPWFSATTALILGLQLLTIATYSLAVLSQWLLPERIYPLLTANLILFLAAILLLILDHHSLIRKDGSHAVWLPDLRLMSKNRGGKPGVWREQRFFFLSLILFTVYAAYLAFYSFHQSGAVVSVGVSVFGDFAPHTALVSSFAKGRNFPADYPHFSGDGIAYHFLFYFLCGNLQYLGLPIDLAINLPSILVFVAFCVLLGTLAVSITRCRASFFLASFLMFFRSSFAFLTRLRDLWQRPDASLATIMAEILSAQVFIGDTPRDDWGLWGPNVYANQRHLLMGFAALIIVVFLFAPFLTRARSEPSASRLALRNPNSLLPRTEERGRVLAAWLIVVLLPYFHGSALLALLAILGGMALFSRARLVHAAIGLSAVVSALIQGRLFRSGGSFINPQFYFGFIAENRSFLGIMAYLIEMSGLVLPLALIYVLLNSKHGRLLFCFSLPLLLGMSISLTPDITVNHKFLIITFALLGCLVSGLLINLWKKRGRMQAVRRLAAAILLFLLTATGMMELIIFHNLNRNHVEVRLDSPLIAFVEKSTPPQAVFVTSPLHLNALFFSGRQIYFGHAYYAWSAGHDTRTRELLERQFLAAPDEDVATADLFIKSERVDYLIIDDDLRHQPDLSINESFFRQHYRQVAAFPELGNLLILDLHQPA